MRVSGVPFDQGVNAAGPLNPTACVLHRTYGAWKGDYQVGKRGRADSPGIGFHFLVGPLEGQWCQFYDTQVKTGHAKGANSWSFGIEITGTNDDALTDWQVRGLAHILGEALQAHRIPVTYYDGPRQRVTGCLAHNSVPGSDHTDLITRADWDRIVAAMGAPVHSQQDTPPAPAPNITPTTEGTDVRNATIYEFPDGGLWLINAGARMKIADANEANLLVIAGAERFPGQVPWNVANALSKFNPAKATA